MATWNSMEETFFLDNPKRMKAVSHPLRLGILRLLLQGNKTNEELAKALNVASGKLYFHTKTLLDVGMIELAETRVKGSIVEKVYKPTFTSFYQPPGDGVAEPVLYSTVSEGARLYFSRTTIPAMTIGRTTRLCTMPCFHPFFRLVSV